MKTVGIIAEYNPFHNGHAYQINKIKELTGADYVVIAMSGDFVQRGAPAIIDKYARTKMALSCGADLVVELPVLWATSSAESFAMAGVTLFDKLGCVDILCFGAESDNLPLLSAIADILVDEPESYRYALSSYLKSGLNFPSARTKALIDCCSAAGNANSKNPNNANINWKNLTDILNSPNNILAIEYLKALRCRESKITPVLIKREGAGYHDTTIVEYTDIPENTNAASDSTFAESADILKTANTASGSPIVGSCLSDTDLIPASGIRASATAIREMLTTACDSQFTQISSTSEKQFTIHALPNETIFRFKQVMPDAALNILSEYCAQNPLLTADDFSPQLAYRLLFADNYHAKKSNGAQTFRNFCDSNEDISNRIAKNRNQFLSFSQFCELNKSRDITYTRMSRILLHILLGLTNDDLLLGKELDYIPYFRLLGFRKASSPLLSEIKRCASVPMISKLSDAGDLLDEKEMLMLRQDIFAAELYEQVLSLRKKTIPRSEYTREIVRL